MTRIPLSLRWLIALILCGVAGPATLAQTLSPGQILGLWEFNDTNGFAQSLDWSRGTPAVMLGNTRFSGDAAGRSGAPGDYAMDFGILGNSSARVVDAGFFDLINANNANNDQITIVFWQRWSTNIANSSTVWFISPGTGSQQRGLQTHCPFGNSDVYFDTGNAAGGFDRINRDINDAFPGFNWQTWHHFALVKNGAGKEIWIDGQLFHSGTGTPLRNDFTELLLGQVNGSSSQCMRGLLDDFAVFGVALTPAQIADLAAGNPLTGLAPPANQWPPQFSAVFPPNGTVAHPAGSGLSFVASTVNPNSIAPGGIQLFLNDVNVSGTLSIGGTGTRRTVSYIGALESNRLYTARAIVTDNNGVSSTNVWAFDTSSPNNASGPQLNLVSLGTVRHSSELPAPKPAALAVDGNVATFSETADGPTNFWEVELIRPYRMKRIDIVAPAGPGYDGMLNGLVLRIQDLRDRTLFTATISGIGAGGLWSTNLPVPAAGRIIRLELPEGWLNGAGNTRVAIGEVRVFGDPSPMAGPASLNSIATVFQSSTNGTFDPTRAIDGNPGTYSETLDVANSYWLLTLDRVRPVERIEIVNRTDAANASRLQGLTLRVLDNSMNSVVSAAVVNPGASNNFVYTPPPGTSGRFIRIGLEKGLTNGQGNFIVSLAEVNVMSASNYAVGAPSYMTRSHDGLLPVANVNDGNYSTRVLLNQSTVDGYFEVDLGEPRALYSVRAVSADGMQSRTAHATMSLFDAAHTLIYAKHLSGASEVFDIDLPSPVLARFVKVGLEYKERTSPTGGTEWVFGLKELQAFGKATNEVGLLNFSASSTQIVAGAFTLLNWQERDLRELVLHPNIGSVGANTGTNGLGSRTVQPTNTTEYTLVGTTYSNTFARALTIRVNGQDLPAKITEFMADNKVTLRDGYGDASDWIELHNPNNTPLDLSGYGLSDDAGVPMKWSFPPGVIIPPHEYLVVFASGRETLYDTNGFLHATFSLNDQTESVILTASNGVTADSVLNYAPQREDLAFGRTLEGAWKFLEPTPGAPNIAAAYAGWLSAPDFSHQRGWYTNGFSLTISNANPESELLISLDGTEPSIPYAGGISVTNTRVVRAGVRRAGYKPPRTRTHTYLFLEGIVASPGLSATYTQDPLYSDRLRQGLREIPTFCVSVPPAAPVVNAERVEREASVEIFMPDGTDIQENCGINHFGGAFGNGTGNPYGKKSYQLKFRAEFGARKLTLPLFAGFDHGFLAQDSFDEIDLHAGNHDMSSRGFYLSHRFAADTMLDMGSLNPHGRFVHLYINGVYWGMYDAHERLTDSFLSEYLPGPKESFLTVKGNDNGPAGNFTLGVPDPPDRGPWEFARTNANSYVTISNRVDVPNLIDFMLVWNWGNAEAEYRAAGARAPGNGGFKFWLADADGHLRNPGGIGTALVRDGTAIAGPGLIFGNLFTEGHPEFKTLLADRIYRHFFNNGAMTPAANDLRMNLRMAEITNAMVAECARWGFRTPENWEAARLSARDDLFPYRNDILLDYMRSRGWYPADDVPELNQYGGSVSNGFPLLINWGTGTVYYTLDGSDPRLPGGMINPNALIWTGGPLYITNHLVFRARLLNVNQWSALADAAFFIAPLRQPEIGDLVISEIHYNPAGSDDYEFIEIYNTSSNLLDLTNVRLMDGVDYLFPNNFRLAPGGFVQVVENVTAFNARYRTNTSPYYHSNLVVAGAWSGQLNNGGERIALVASNNVELAAVSYSNGGSWPSRADNRGSSLELRTPPVMQTNAAALNAHLDRGPNWRSSAIYHGSPGRLDTLPRNIVISEVVAHTDVGVDWIELQNTTASSITLSNYYLSDNYDLPFKYAFPGGASIPAGGFLIRNATQLGFGFSELGSDILLVQSIGTNIVRFVDTTDIPAANKEEPFGRYTRLDSVVDFTELRSKSPLTTNTLPRIGPLVFSEIMYHPTNGNAEFVEIVNLAATNVPLYDPARPTNVWELSDAIDFRFPSGQQLAPGAVLIVCATNPSAFRTQYGVSPSIAVYGPWTNVLDNAGEALRLRRPGLPETNGFVPYYRVDRVRYEPIAPWPAGANQGGVSLQRITLEAYGNEPANWQASVSGGTPGTFTGNRLPVLAVDGSPTVSEGAALELSASAGDPDEPWQTVALSAQNLPPGATFNPSSGLLSWTPSETQGPGVYAVRFLATDSGVVPLVRTQTVNISVLESNRPPSLTPVASFLYPRMLALTLDLIATDPDLPAQSLSFAAAGLPSGLSIHPTTGRITGSAASQGSYPVLVSVADDQLPPLVASNSFTLTISEPFLAQSTAINGQPQFSFWSIAGESYEVFYATRLNPPNWQLLQQIPSATGGLQLVGTPAGLTNCFIRVKWIRD